MSGSEMISVAPSVNSPEVMDRVHVDHRRCTTVFLQLNDADDKHA